MTSPRGPLAVRRMTARWVVPAAAALTTAVAATAAALAVFPGDSPPLQAGVPGAAGRPDPAAGLRAAEEA